MSKQSSRTIVAFVLAVSLGFIGGIASWWWPAKQQSTQDPVVVGEAVPSPAREDRARAIADAHAGPDARPWLKGELRAPTNSGEAQVVRAFAEKRYDFLVLETAAAGVKGTGAMPVYQPADLLQDLPTCADPAVKEKACLVTLDPNGASQPAWDKALAGGAKALGVGSGSAFVMVKAKPEPQAIRASLIHGDFYVSTGVRLDRIEVKDGLLEIEVGAAEPPGELHFAFIGTGGEFLADTRGREARLDLSIASAGYVRAVVTNAAGQKAWTQPVIVPVQ